MTIHENLGIVRREAETLFSRTEVEAAICRVGAAITARLAERDPVILTVLNGGIIFCGRLLLELSFPLELDSVSVSRYHGLIQGTELEWKLKPSIPLRARSVLLVDDVLDEGITLAELKQFCLAEGAEQVLIAVLVEKKLAREKPCQADFVGLEADDRYLFGYGMDYRNYLRNAAGIFACTHLTDAS
ncbi:MAG: hypoxanthine-guanine phosphoribosyltransferase [Methylotetracoccus sp.]|nr:hypoxanthine-guanine phosphoribosyltransferase [Methylotetracoccus sp.]